MNVVCFRMKNSGNVLQLLLHALIQISHTFSTLCCVALEKMYHSKKTQWSEKIQTSKIVRIWGKNLHRIFTYNFRKITKAHLERSWNYTRKSQTIQCRFSVLPASSVESDVMMAKLLFSIEVSRYSLGSMHVCFNTYTWPNDARQQAHGFVQSIVRYQGDFIRYDDTALVLHICTVMERNSTNLQPILFYVWVKQITEYSSGVDKAAANATALGGPVGQWGQTVKNAKTCFGLSD